MARGINRVTLIANACADAEFRSTASGSGIASVRLATNESWTDKNTGEKQERTEYHRVKFFGRLAEIAAEYIRKGQQVYIEGSLRTDKYTDKDGIERYTTDVIASEMQLLGNRSQGGGQAQDERGDQRQRHAGNGGNGGNGGRGGTQARQAPRQAPDRAPAYADHDMGGSDDVPF